MRIAKRPKKNLSESSWVTVSFKAFHSPCSVHRAMKSGSIMMNPSWIIQFALYTCSPPLEATSNAIPSEKKVSRLVAAMSICVNTNQ